MRGVLVLAVVLVPVVASGAPLPGLPKILHGRMMIVEVPGSAVDIAVPWSEGSGSYYGWYGGREVQIKPSDSLNPSPMSMVLEVSGTSGGTAENLGGLLPGREMQTVLGTGETVIFDVTGGDYGHEWDDQTRYERILYGVICGCWCQILFETMGTFFRRFGRAVSDVIGLRA